MRINVKVDPAVFNDVYKPHLHNYSRVQIYYGGSGSGKSRFLAQRYVLWALQGGRNTLVCRQVARTVRGSVAQEISKVITAWGLSNLFAINKTDGTITCKNGYQIIFAGLDDVEKLKSITPAKGVITDIWVEEATEADQHTVKQLMKRQRGGSDETKKTITLSFNPILRSHWIYTTYFAPIVWRDDQTTHTSRALSILKTWYIHNKFLTADDIADLTNETDKYLLDVYAYGNWGILGNVIFTNWETADLSGMAEQFTNHRHGLDFGFAGDPAAVVCTHYDKARKTIYIYDELYERGLTNNLLAAEVRRMVGNQYVTCDSAEPKSIYELQTHYNLSALAAEKGKDSVTHGVQWLQQQKIVIGQNCVNAINEFQQYKWREDKDGNAIRQPVDKNNHIIDALRYAYESEYKAGELFFFGV